jgi:hypothetical protein
MHTFSTGVDFGLDFTTGKLVRIGFPPFYLVLLDNSRGIIVRLAASAQLMAHATGLHTHVRMFVADRG